MHSYQYLVYSLLDKNTNEILYIGSGTLDRVKHLQSGRSHNSSINEAFFTRETKINIICYTQRKEVAYELEQNLITYCNPPFNKRIKTNLCFMSLIKYCVIEKKIVTYSHIIEAIKCDNGVFTKLTNALVLMYNNIYDYNKFKLDYMYYTNLEDNLLYELLNHNLLYSKVKDLSGNAYSSIHGKIPKGFSSDEIKEIMKLILNPLEDAFDDLLFESLSVISPSTYQSLTSNDIAA